MGREYELKYQATPAVLAQLQQRFHGFAPITMETHYYDTPDRFLSQQRWMLRRRLENGRSVCTVKIPLADGSRGEWETEAASPEAAIKKLCALGAPAQLEAMADKGLRKICGAQFLRLAAIIQLPDCTLELALDQGCFLGGTQQVPFCELEVELKDGMEAAAASFAEDLAKAYALTPESRSKVQRAMALVP